jgi:hypothetical protein
MSSGSRGRAARGSKVTGQRLSGDERKMKQRGTKRREALTPPASPGGTLAGSVCGSGRAGHGWSRRRQQHGGKRRVSGSLGSGNGTAGPVSGTGLTSAAAAAACVPASLGRTRGN